MAPPAPPLPPSPPPPEVGDALGDAPPGGPPRKRAGDALSDALPALLPWLSPTDATSTASTCRTTRAALRAPDPAAAPGGRFAAARELARRGWRTPALEASPLWGAGWPARTAAARDVLACAAPRADLATGTEPSLGEQLNTFRGGTTDAVGCELRLPGGKVLELGVLRGYLGEEEALFNTSRKVLTRTLLYVRDTTQPAGVAALLASCMAADNDVPVTSGVRICRTQSSTWICKHALERAVRRLLVEAGLSSVKALDDCLLVTTLFLAHDVVAPGQGAPVHVGESVADLWVREAHVRLDASVPDGYTPRLKTGSPEPEENYNQIWPLTIEARRRWEANKRVALQQSLQLHIDHLNDDYDDYYGDYDDSEDRFADCPSRDYDPGGKHYTDDKHG